MCTFKFCLNCDVFVCCNDFLVVLCLINLKKEIMERATQYNQNAKLKVRL